MSTNTYQAIIDATDLRAEAHWWTGSETPAGTFAVGTIMGGKVLTYLMVGAFEGDQNARIIGKSISNLTVPVDADPIVGEPSYYAGGGIHGGVCLNAVSTDHEAFALMARMEKSRARLEKNRL